MTGKLKGKVAVVTGASSGIGEATVRSQPKEPRWWPEPAAKSTFPIPGAKNKRQARQNAGALGWEITSEEAEKLELATLGWR